MRAALEREYNYQKIPDSLVVSSQGWRCVEGCIELRYILK
jgi:hypothetical protein